MRRHNGHSIIIAAALALAGCSACNKDAKHKPVDPPAADTLDAELEATALLYLELQPTVADAEGFIHFDKCDSTTFSALIGAAGATVNLSAAIQPDGKMLRRPTSYPSCYPEHSKSDNSKDQFVAVLLNGLVNGNLDLLEHVFRYGRKHGWVMGLGLITRTYLTTTLRGQFAKAIKSLGGTVHEPEIWMDQVWLAGLEGFESHLQVVSILAYGLTHNGITDWGLDRLREHHHRQPLNPFFAAAFWRYSGDEAARDAARAILRNAQYFPPERLPTSADRCEPWLTQRDAEIILAEGRIPNDSWLPCAEENQTHSGGDFLVAHAILTGRI